MANENVNAIKTGKEQEELQGDRQCEQYVGHIDCRCGFNERYDLD